MYLKCFSFFFLLFFNYTTFAQQRNYTTLMQHLSDSIHTQFYKPQINYYKEGIDPQVKYKKASYLWPLCAMFEAANEVGVVTNNYNLFETVFSVIQKYRNEDKPAPGYASYAIAFGGGSRFYDDNQWIGITAMDAYFRTNDKKWLAVGVEIYKFMMTGYDTLTGGSLYWQEDKKNTKNTCSNGPGILLALQLYKATGQQNYLQVARQLYEWVNRHLKTPSNLYFDNINVTTNKIDKRVYSYNTGTMLQSAVRFYEITKNEKYLNEAKAIAAASAIYFFKRDVFEDSYWFNAVLLRAYQHLLKYDSDKVFIMKFKTAVESTIKNDSAGLNNITLNRHKNLVEYGGYLEILARFAQLQKQGVIK